jgi:hypothetical protein
MVLFRDDRESNVAAVEVDKVGCVKILNLSHLISWLFFLAKVLTYNK